MKFSEKLQTLRKAKKMSQEDLSVLMDVSRQSVSKWESGTSYPEMDKLLQLCKIFSCTLDELTNDEIKEINVTKEEKVTPKNLVDNFFNSIENVYHFVTTRTPKEMLKIGIEFFLFLFIFILCNFPISIIFSMIHRSLMQFDLRLFEIVGEFLNLIAQILYWIMATIIYTHIFKIRYINEWQVPENKKEEPKKEKEKEEKKSIKIIETKTNISISNFLMKIIIYCLKGILFCFSLAIIGVLIALCIVLSILIMCLLDHLVFIGFILCTVGGIALASTLLSWFFHFIFNSKINLKKVFISLLSNTILIGLSLGISLMELTQYDFIEGIPNNMEEVEVTQTLSYKDNMYFENYEGYYPYDGNITYEIDNKVDKNQIKIVYKNNKYYKRSIYINEINNSYQINHTNNIKTKEFIKDIKENLKEKKFYSYDIQYTDYKIIGCKETITELTKTMEKKQEERRKNMYQEELFALREEMNYLENEKNYLQDNLYNLLDENEKYKEQIKEYEDTINGLKDMLAQ